MSKNTSNAFPWLGLLALAMAGFIAVMTETVPAGLLPKIAEGLHISDSLAGQLVTLYGIGSLIAAIPVTLATQNWRRRPLLLLTILVFLIFNTLTALSTIYVLTLVSRFFAGVAAGVVWSTIAGYAMRMVDTQFKGRAIAVALAGTPIALSLGVPAGTFLGAFLGWRLVFGIISILSLVLMGWILWKVPDFPGQISEKRHSIGKLFGVPGVLPILFVVLTWMLAHNILYAYITPFLAHISLQNYVELVLFVFGITALLGIWIVGLLINRWLRLMVLISLMIFAIASLLLAISSANITIVFLSMGLWGLSFGGAGTLIQTALAQAAGEEAVDLAISMSATFWNLAIAGGGLIGGVLLDTLGVQSIPWTLLILVVMALMIAWRAKKYSFVKHVETD